MLPRTCSLVRLQIPPWLRRCSIGSVGEFDPSSESFTAYLERLALDQFFVANDIGKCADDATAAVVRPANEKKVAMMTSIFGKKTYSTLRDLCSPENLKNI